MRLIDVDLGQQVKVTGFRGGQAVSRKLRQLGLLPGDSARVMRHAPFGGPVMIEVNGRTLALGRGIAAKITVEVEQENS
jgi:ferrous iron transport protein A